MSELFTFFCGMLLSFLLGGFPRASARREPEPSELDATQIDPQVFKAAFQVAGWMRGINALTRGQQASREPPSDMLHGLTPEDATIARAAFQEALDRFAAMTATKH